MFTPAGARRAKPMPPQERRAALIAATLPLLCQYGNRVTTRQIAEAASVAEGTIFRAFRDKEELIQCAMAAALDPAPALADLDAVDPALPLRVRLMQVTSILQRRLHLVFSVMIAVGVNAPPQENDQRRRAAHAAHAGILDRIVELLEPDRDQFRCPVQEVARLLQLMTFCGSHPIITDGHLLTADEITDVLLDGVRSRDSGTDDERGHRPC